MSHRALNCVISWVVNVLLFASASCFAQQPGTAQGYPVKPVKLIVTSGPGSSPDINSRIVIPKLMEFWGQPVLVENVAGSAGNIGAERAAKSAPDGYTLLWSTAGPLQFNMSLYSKLNYDIVGDFEPIMGLMLAPNILAVHPSLPVNSVQELIAYARINPGKLRFGSPGSGSSQHLSGELFKKMAGVDMVHVPYKSSAQMTLELVGGAVRTHLSKRTGAPSPRQAGTSEGPCSNHGQPHAPGARVTHRGRGGAARVRNKRAIGALCAQRDSRDHYQQGACRHGKSDGDTCGARATHGQWIDHRRQQARGICRFAQKRNQPLGADHQGFGCDGGLSALGPDIAMPDRQIGCLIPPSVLRFGVYSTRVKGFTLAL